MKEINVRFIERIKRTPTIDSFRFIPVEKIDFIPGQFSEIIFDENKRSNKELNKYLSFSSSPAKNYIEVTKRLSNSQFSQKLQGLTPGDEVLFKTPLGNCVFKNNYKKIGFLIGGIGITPVISIIGYIIDNNLNTDICLAYSNRTEEDIAFKKELDYWQKINKNIKVYYLVSDCRPKDSSCVFGRIDLDFLKSGYCDSKDRIFFIFGPPKMVEAMGGLCLEIGCNKENIKTENFIGY